MIGIQRVTWSPTPSKKTRKRATKPAAFGATAAAFAERSTSVTVVHPCPVTVQIIRHRLASLNVPNVVVVHVPPGDITLPFEDASFDAFLHHDVAGTLATNPVAAVSPFASLTATLVQEAHRLVRPDGFAYFGVQNPYGYNTWQRRMTLAQSASTPSSPSLRRVKRLIRRAGFPPPTIVPYLIEHDHVSEILPPEGYRSVKNSLSRSERLKETVLGKFGARLLAPAYGLICLKGQLRDTQLQLLAADLATHTGSPICPGFRRYFCMPGKVFVTLEHADAVTENVIVVIPKIPSVREGRRKELEVVTELRALSPFLAAKLPTRYFEASCHGEIYFALSEIRGITIDRAVPYLDRLNFKALDFLIRLSEITALATTITTEVYADLIGYITATVSNIYPETRARVETIDNHLRAAVIDRPLHKVWLHGDYKLENLIFDPNTLDMAAVIDWEHSRRNSLPWLDLLYLITYNRMMIDNLNFFDVYRKVILSEQFSTQERPLVQAYAEAIPVGSHVRTALTALFFLHHIGFRYQYDMRMLEDMQNILSTLHEIEIRLGKSR